MPFDVVFRVGGLAQMVFTRPRMRTTSAIFLAKLPAEIGATVSASDPT